MKVRLGTEFAGALLRGFESGWAVTLRDQALVAHWFERAGEGELSTACNLQHRLRTALPFFAPGRFNRCLRCRRVLRKRWGPEIDMGDGERVKFPAADGVEGEGVVVGWVGIDGCAHAIVRLDNGKYRPVPAVRLLGPAREAAAS
jgi:hypothetical protein